MLLLHGLGAHQVEFLPTLAALASERWRVVAIDLPGFGDSDKPFPASYDAAFFAQAGCARSWTPRASTARTCSATAWAAAWRSSWACASPSAWRRCPDDPLDGVARRPAVGRSAQARPPRARPAPAHAASRSSRRSSADSCRAPTSSWVAPALDEFMRAYLNPRGRVAFYAAARKIYLENPNGKDGFWSRLEALQARSLFIWGRRDTLVPIGFARHVKKRASRGAPRASSTAATCRSSSARARRTARSLASCAAARPAARTAPARASGRPPAGAPRRRLRQRGADKIAAWKRGSGAGSRRWLKTSTARPRGNVTGLSAAWWPTTCCCRSSRSRCSRSSSRAACSRATTSRTSVFQDLTRLFPSVAESTITSALSGSRRHPRASASSRSSRASGSARRSGARSTRPSAGSTTSSAAPGCSRSGSRSLMLGVVLLFIAATVADPGRPEHHREGRRGPAVRPRRGRAACCSSSPSPRASCCSSGSSASSTGRCRTGVTCPGARSGRAPRGHARDRHRRLRLPALPVQRLDGRAVRHHARLHRDRAALVLRAGDHHPRRRRGERGLRFELHETGELSVGNG